MAVNVKLDSGEIEKLLRSPEVQRELKRRADNIARAAGPGFRSDVGQGYDRARASVWAFTGAARKAEAENRALTRAIDAGRE